MLLGESSGRPHLVPVFCLITQCNLSVFTCLGLDDCGVRTEFMIEENAFDLV